MSEPSQIASRTIIMVLILVSSLTLHQSRGRIPIGQTSVKATSLAAAHTATLITGVANITIQGQVDASTTNQNLSTLTTMTRSLIAPNTTTLHRAFGRGIWARPLDRPRILALLLILGRLLLIPGRLLTILGRLLTIPDHLTSLDSD